MIKNLYIFILSLVAIATHADNQQGIAYYKAGEPTIASQLFNKQLNGSPSEQAEALYYLGEIAFDAGKQPMPWQTIKKVGLFLPITLIIRWEKGKYY